MQGDLDHEDRDVLALLDDEYARAILRATSLETMSASALSEECDMSLPTVSRRVNRLVDCGFLAEYSHMDPDGHHFSEYEARLDRVVVELLSGRFALNVTVREDAADRFTRIWREMRND